MINTNEIRLGNYYQDRDGKLLRVDFIEYIEKGYSTKFGQKMFLHNQEEDRLTEYSDYANPIELTKEWLIKFGFEEIYNSAFRLKYDHPCNFIGFDFSKNEDKHMEGFRYYGQYIKIKYVHQLQNLYYTLRGEELSLTDNF